MATFGKKIKNFFVEEETTSMDNMEITLDDSVYNSPYYLKDVNTFYAQGVEPVDIQTEDVSSIEEIYKASEMDDVSKSIYRVDEIRSVLPNSLASSTKKESVLGMMQVSGISVEEVIQDAENRKAVLDSVLQSFTESTVKTIEKNTEEIQELEDRINALKEEINNRKLSQEKQEEIINQEIEKIKSIIDFITT